MADGTGVDNSILGQVGGHAIQGRNVTVALPSSPQPVAVEGLPPQAVFVGRVDELAELEVLLAPSNVDSAVVVSAVAGLAGVGKTALAVRAAHRAIAAGWFPGGVLLVNLRGYGPTGQRMTATEALASLLGALGVSVGHLPLGLDERERLWRSMLAQRARTLVLVDNASDSEQVRPLLPGIGGHRIVVTSRHSLSDLQGARLLELDVLPKEQAVELLGQELMTARSDDDRVLVEPEAAYKIVSLCACLPLAIGIAAALLAAEPDQPLSEMREILSDERRRLKELEYDGNLAVRAAFDLSYQSLSKEQAQVFRFMALNPGPEVSTAAVSAMTNTNVPDARRTLAYLRRAHLISQAPSGRGRWQMHDLLRLYCTDQAEQDPERPTAVQRLLDHYLLIVHSANRHIAPEIANAGVDDHFDGRVAALNWLDTERSNLTAAVTLAHSSGYFTRVIDLCYALVTFYSFRKLWSDWISTHNLAIAGARHLRRREHEGRLLNNIGLAYRQSGNLHDALQCHRTAVAIHQESQNLLSEGKALNNLGVVYRQLEQWHESAECHERAVAIYQQCGNSRAEGNALNNLGLTHRRLGKLEEALRCHELSREIFRTLGDRFIESCVLNNLGLIYQDMNRWQEAQACHEQAIEVCKEFDDYHSESSALNNLGLFYQEMGMWNKAVQCHKRAAETYHKLVDRQSEQRTLKNLAIAYWRLGQHEDAKRYLLQSLSNQKPDTARPLDPDSER